MIAELGRDCPGAVVFVPAGQPIEPRDAESLSWLGRDELEQLVLEPQRGLIDPQHRRRMRFALPGERYKLALVRDPAGDRWAWPEAGAPSTHVLKPVDGEMPDFTINAMACMTALRRMGLPVAHTEIVRIAGRRCLVSKRFDRWDEGQRVERLHQESFCQAFGLAPRGQRARGFEYGQVCELLREIGEEEAIGSAFAVAFCDYLLGSRESVHGRRSALLYSSEGPMLAPYCDLHSVGVYDSHRSRRSIYKLIRESSLGGLAPSPIDDPELRPAVIAALETAGGFAKAIAVVAEQARHEGWYGRIISRLLPGPLDSFSPFDDDLFDS